MNKRLTHQNSIQEETLGRIFPVIECNISEDFYLHDGSSWSSTIQARQGELEISSKNICVE